MEKYPRLFIKASLIYLAIGTFLGFSYAFNYLEPLRFAHVHLNLFGFMAMFIFGISYHIIPRFMAIPLKHPELVNLHFYLGNISLIGMVAVYPINYGLIYSFFLFMGLFSVWIFIYNIYPLLSEKPENTVKLKKKQEISQKEEVVKKREIITGDMRVRDILEKYPASLEIFLNAGLRGLANEEHRANLPPVQIQMAAQKHQLDLKPLLEKLNAFIAKEESAEVTTVSKQPLEITKETVLGDLVSAYPQVKPLLEKTFGEGCFSCPGAKTETIEQAALMHNKEPDLIVKNVKLLLKQE